MRAGSIDALLTGPRYHGYTYSYPHKTAYRPLEAPRPLAPLWAAEDRSSLFLYLHVPLCEMRCGFCNLFTQVGATGTLAVRYLDQLERQAARVREALGEARFTRVAFGGGTPTFLPVAQLERLFDIAEATAGSLAAVPVGLETSPRTATDDRLRLARDRGVDRVSIGVQSFFDDELRALGRPSTAEAAMGALRRIRAHGFRTLNIDLIYGAGGQTTATWQSSIETALGFEPEELYLYPLYVRPLTGLGRRPGPSRGRGDVRETMYQAGRERLLEAGYEQVSLRMFRRRGHGDADAPVYCCQDDGMVGLGCGARSYTRGLHYADDWAVAARSVKGITADWLERPEESFDAAQYGIDLDATEQRRRFVLQSVATASGLQLARYRSRFGTEPTEDLPQLVSLLERGLLTRLDGALAPTAKGLAWADAIGPWLYSEGVRARMEGFVLR